MRTRYYHRPGHPKADAWGFVEQADLGEEPAPMAINAPIMLDRFYENTAATDGTDIGSRRKHREYMRVHGLTTADDYGGQWKKDAARREAIKEGKLPSQTRRDAIGRAMYKIDKP